MARDLVLPDDEANRNFSVGRKISQHPVHTSSSQPKDSTWPNFLHPVACQFTRYLFLLLAANTDIKGKSTSTGNAAETHLADAAVVPRRIVLHYLRVRSLLIAIFKVE